METYSEKPFITVFIPTYNREHLLSRLYESLLRQTVRNFKVLIIDDGSTDNTAETVRQWMKSGILPIRYIYQENQRKHIAYNRAIREADTELFLEIDSDDYLYDDALERITSQWLVCDSERFCGMQFLCGDPEGNLIGSEFPAGVEYADNFDLRYNLRIAGDKFMVYDSVRLKKHLLPEVNDKYVQESILHNRVSRENPFLLINEIIGVKDYQPAGISRGSGSILDTSLNAQIIKMNECQYFRLTRKQYLFFSSRYVKYSLMAGHGIRRIIAEAINLKPLFALAIISGYCKWLHEKCKKKK